VTYECDGQTDRHYNSNATLNYVTRTKRKKKVGLQQAAFIIFFNKRVYRIKKSNVDVTQRWVVCV